MSPPVLLVVNIKKEIQTLTLARDAEAEVTIAWASPSAERYPKP